MAQKRRKDQGMKRQGRSVKEARKKENKRKKLYSKKMEKGLIQTLENGLGRPSRSRSGEREQCSKQENGEKKEPERRAWEVKVEKEGVKNFTKGSNESLKIGQKKE